MEIREQAEAILELRHRTKGEPRAKQTKEDKRIGDDKYKCRIKIDSKLADMSDQSFIAEMMGYEG